MELIKEKAREFTTHSHEPLLNEAQAIVTSEPANVKQPVLCIFVAADGSLPSSMSSTEKR